MRARPGNLRVYVDGQNTHRWLLDNHAGREWSNASSQTYGHDLDRTEQHADKDVELELGGWIGVRRL